MEGTVQRRTNGKLSHNEIKEYCAQCRKISTYHRLGRESYARRKEPKLEGDARKMRSPIAHHSKIGSCRKNKRTLVRIFGDFRVDCDTI